MSYEIIYNKQFLKTLEGKIIPIILNGSNNCTTVGYTGRERRVRDWSICNMPHWCNYKIDFTPQELLKEQEQWLDRNEMFKYGNKWLDGKQWYNFVKNAIKNAKTIEELETWERPTVYITMWKGLEHSTLTDRRIINNSQELQDFINQYNDMINSGIEGLIYPHLDFGTEKFKHQKKGKRQPKEKLTKFYTVVVDKGYAEFFVQQITARRLFYTQCKEYAKQFKTEQEALKWITERRINSRFNITCFVKLVA